jgi:hypothetical protein
MAKSVEEILASNDSEAAFLLLSDPGKGPDVEVPGLFENFDALQKLAMPWRDDAHEGGGIKILGKLSTDENRRIMLRATIAESGFPTLISMFGDDRVAAHRPLLVEFFLEHADDPGYFDEFLEDQADKLTDDQKLKLLDAKGKLG